MGVWGEFMDLSSGGGVEGEDSPRNRPLERAVLFTLATVQFTSIVDFMVIMPLGPQLERTMGINPEQFGFIVSAYTISAGLTGVVASTVIDRFSRKSAFLTLYVGFLVGTLLCGLAPSYHLLLAARVVTGAFGGVLGGMAMAIVGDVFPDERRGRATGVLMSAFSLASIFGVPIGLFLGNQYGWHAPFLMLVVLGLPILFVGMFTLPTLRGHLGKAKAGRLEVVGRDLYESEPSSGVRFGGLGDAGDVPGGPVHQPVSGLERGPDRAGIALDLLRRGCLLARIVAVDRGGGRIDMGS